MKTALDYESILTSILNKPKIKYQHYMDMDYYRLITEEPYMVATLTAIPEYRLYIETDKMRYDLKAILNNILRDRSK